MANASSGGYGDDLTYGCDGEINGSVPRVEAILNAVFIIVVLVFTVFGNSLVCIAIFRYRKLRTLTNSLLCSLAVTDLLTPCLRLLFMAISLWYDRWVFGCVWCVLSAVCGVFLCSSSILHLIAISVERFLVIKWPLRHKKWINRSNVIVLFILIWSVSLLMSLFPYFGLVRMSFSVYLIDCEIFWQEKPKLSILLAAVYFAFPFVVMLLAYYHIYKQVQAQTRKISQFSIGSAEERKKRAIRQEWKAVKVVIVVIGIFFTLWLPFFIVTAVRSYYPESVPGWLKRLVMFLAYLNSSCNWVVYSVMNKPLRNAFKQIMCLSKMDYQSASQKWARLRALVFANKNIHQNESRFQATSTGSAYVIQNDSTPKASLRIPETAEKIATITGNEHSIHSVDKNNNDDAPLSLSTDKVEIEVTLGSNDI